MAAGAETTGARKRISFHETEPIPTYLFSFVGGRFERVTENRNGRSISLYHRETDLQKTAQCPEILGQVFHALDWLETYTGVPYPFAKYDLIVIPGFQYGGMEHMGATLYADRSMFLENNATTENRMARGSLIAHETAHMWFGDYVTMQWFDDVWTKEVFANFFAAMIVREQVPADRPPAQLHPLQRTGSLRRRPHCGKHGHPATVTEPFRCGIAVQPDHLQQIPGGHGDAFHQTGA